MTEAVTCDNDGHDTIPAVALLVYHAQGALLGEALCRACATCRDSGCTTLNDIFDSTDREPWCTRHADAFGPGEHPAGPDIVELGSVRHAELLADPDTAPDHSARPTQAPPPGSACHAQAPITH